MGRTKWMNEELMAKIQKTQDEISACDVPEQMTDLYFILLRYFNSEKDFSYIKMWETFHDPNGYGPCTANEFVDYMTYWEGKEVLFAAENDCDMVNVEVYDEYFNLESECLVYRYDDKGLF